MKPDKRNNNDSGNNKRNALGLISIILWALFLTLLFRSCWSSYENAGMVEVPYTTFKEWLEADKIQQANVESGQITFTLREGVEVELPQQEETGGAGDLMNALLPEPPQDETAVTEYVTVRLSGVSDVELMNQLEEHLPDGAYTKPVDNSAYLLNLFLAYILPILVMVGLFLFMFRVGGKGGIGGMGNLGKSNAKVYVEKKTGVTFRDVAGQDEAKESLQEIIDILHNPQKYTEIGAKLPKGALLVGPPGTGKTLLAKAVAGEANVPFFSISGSDFVEMFVGMGAARVRDLFKEAAKMAPCIIFIDEIDTIGKSRDNRMGGNDEREQTLNQLLAELDGFDPGKGIIVLGATNRPEVLYKALLRPGRFDRRVYMGLPDIKGREEILKVHARGKPLGDDVDLKSIARGTAGFAGADLENLLNEAAIMATRSKRRFIMQADIDEAILKVVMGPEKKSRVVSERARRLTAYHESGHAIASFFLKNADPVHYITIIPRGAAGGFTWYRKAEDAEDFTSRGEMFDSIVSALGGRIAEQLFLEDISTGASGDIQQATNIARDMVMKYGMSEKLGPISFDDSSHSIFIGRDFGTTKSYSEETAATIDEEVKHIFDQAYAKCEALLREHADLLTGLAEYLLIHETIEGDDFRYYCEHGQMPIHPDDTIEPPAKVIRRMDEAPETPQPEAPSAPDVDAPNSDPGEQP